jgi:hypothetical protein
MAKIKVERPNGGVNVSAGGVIDGARDSVREAGPWLVRLARAGYAAKGIVYFVIGGLAVLAATGAGGGTTDSRGALGVIGESGGGRALLLAMGIGLIAYALWAQVAALTDAERRGDDAKGITTRIGLAGRGIAYGALGVEAIRLFVTARPGNGNGAEHWTARVMALPAGRWLVVGAGAVIAGYALYQWWRAANKDLRKRLHLSEAGPEQSRWIVRLARFGIAARGVVFLVIGWFLIQAGLRYESDRAGGIDESLAALLGTPYGPVVLGVVAIGLVAYGTWELANARYREMSVD